MPEQAAAYSADTLTTQPVVPISTLISDASNALVSTSFHTAANEQAALEDESLTWNDSQRVVSDLNARRPGVPEPLLTVSSTTTVHAGSQHVRHSPTQRREPRKVSGPLDSESAVETRVDAQHIIRPPSVLDTKPIIPETHNNTIADAAIGRFERLKYARRMCKRFNNATEQSPHPHRHFLPNFELSKLGGHEVREALSKSRKTPISVENPENYRKIFVVLCLMKMPTKVRWFIEGHICDADLPLCVAETPRKRGDPYLLKSQNGPNINTVKFKWKSDADDFCKRQWVVLAPTFMGSDGTNIPHHVLHNREVLPFKSSYEIGKGSFGEVSYVEIFTGHHKLADNCNFFAIKKLKSNLRSDFIAEVTILRKLRQTQHQHDHLIALLATYEIGGEYHFIFPWAEADLFSYWKRYPNPKQSPEMEDWIFQQCLGLIAALRKIHRYETYSNSSILALHIGPRGSKDRMTVEADTEPSDKKHKTFVGRHGDLKPDNILWFPANSAAEGPDRGILKIGDFGSARFSKEDSWYDAKHGRIPNSPTYQSPEYQLDDKYSTLCDIWALGCIYLECITWYFGGYIFVKQFGTARLERDETLAGIKSDTFFSVVGQGKNRRAKVKSSVRKMIEDLYSHKNCTSRFKALLDIINDQMLVVNEKDRINADDLELQHSTSGSLAVPGHNRSRRSSSTAILHDLGDLVPGSKEYEESAAQSGLQPGSLPPERPTHSNASPTELPNG